MKKPTRREREGGFALLLVFVMAAVLAISLYMEVPRIAFESQRQKEQLLMERGQQYQMAIRRFQQRGIKQGMNQMVGPPWPTKIEDLENTNGRRFLRKRYIDPMTGKDEWRIIHINNGVLTDSINNKPQNNNQQTGLAPGGIGEFAGLGQTPAGPQQGGANMVNARRRASDNAGPGGGNGVATGDPNQPGNPANPGNPPGSTPPTGPVPPGGIAGPQPGVPAGLGGGIQFPGQPGIPGQPGQPIQPFPGNMGNAGQPQQNNGQSNNGQSNNGGSGFTGMTNSFGSGQPTASTAPNGQPLYAGQTPGIPGMPVNSNTGGQSPYPIAPGANGTPPGFPQPGAAANGQMSPAGLINSLLTQPRPGGMPQVVNTAGNTTLGGGMAGVASNLDADSIMVCGDHSNYQEWEFIYDPSKWKAPANPNTQLGGKPLGNSPNSSGNPSNMGSPIGQPIGSPAGGSSSGSSASTSSGGFGSSGSVSTSGGPGGLGSSGPSTFGSNGPGGNSPGSNNRGGSGAGQPGGQGNFGTVCGMEARPGVQ